MRTPSQPAESSLQTYYRVSELVQQGHSHQARELALTISADHLRCRRFCWPTTAEKCRGPRLCAADQVLPERRASHWSRQPPGACPPTRRELWLPVAPPGPGCAMFFVVVTTGQLNHWKTLRRLDTLAEALAAYRGVAVGPRQAKVLMQRDRQGWHVLAQAAGEIADEPTDQAWTEATDQERVGPAVC